MTRFDILLGKPPPPIPEEPPKKELYYMGIDFGQFSDTTVIIGQPSVWDDRLHFQLYYDLTIPRWTDSIKTVQTIADNRIAFIERYTTIKSLAQIRARTDPRDVQAMSQWFSCDSVRNLTSMNQIRDRVQALGIELPAVRKEFQDSLMLAVSMVIEDLERKREIIKKTFITL